MPLIHLLTEPVTADKLAHLVFAGDLVVFKSVEPLVPFLKFADSAIRSVLAPHDPVTAQDSFEESTYTIKLEQLRKEFRAHPEARRLFQSALIHTGVDPDLTGWDWLQLRIQPPTMNGKLIGTLGVHRDTWASNVYEQINWWTPIYPITAERTVVIYPAYWSRPLANNSKGWEIENVVSQRKLAKDAYARSSIIHTPVPVESVDTSSEARIVIEPGDLLCFSAAHLHASTINTSALARFSIEARTVSLEDLRYGRRAPNIDGLASGCQLKWFHRLTDEASIEVLWEEEKKIHGMSPGS